MTIPLDEFYSTTARAESRNNPNAQNPYSSARGLYQWTDRTWNGVVRNYGQRYGIRPDGRGDRAQEDLAIRAITENEYLPLVQRAGRNPDTAELYLPHFLGGPAYQRLTRVDPNTPAVEAFRGLPHEWDEVFSVNAPVFRNNRNITAGQVLEMARAYHDRHRGGSGTPGPRKAPEAPQAPPPVASTPAPTVPGPSASRKSRIFSALRRIFQFRKD